MPPKRRRVSEGPEEQTQQAATTPNPTPQDEVWYADGNIVLATERHLYRVHKSILAKYSTVFADMFKFEMEGFGGEEGNGQQVQVNGGAMDALNDRWEGVPIVQMHGDSDEDVKVILKSVYDHK